MADDLQQPADFWDVMEGRVPPPPAATTLGWSLSWVAADPGEIEVFFDAAR